MQQDGLFQFDLFIFVFASQYFTLLCDEKPRLAQWSSYCIFSVFLCLGGTGVGYAADLQRHYRLFSRLICEKYAGRWQAKAALGSSLVLNLGLLGIFKYSGMLVESINGLTGLSLPVPGFFPAYRHFFLHLSDHFVCD